MRPNADISHQLNGRVRDIADENDWDLTEAYAEVIEHGVKQLEKELDEENRSSH